MGYERTVYGAGRNNAGRYRPKAQRADSAAIPAPAGTEVRAAPAQPVQSISASERSEEPCWIYC